MTPSKALLEFGLAMKEARQSAGLTQRELGERLGLSQASIASYETGVNEPSPDQVFGIEDVLDAPAGALSKRLGYLPTDWSGRKHMTFADFVEVEESELTPDQRRLLLGLYEELTGGKRPTKRKRRG